jgi:hypothetical protein
MRFGYCLIVLSACGSDPVSFSMPVGIALKATSSDVSNSVLSDDKAITTESANPYGMFVSDARTRLGKDPSRIEIDKLTLILGAQSTRVVALDEIYAGDVDVAFIMNDTNATYDVGHATNPSGVGPVDVHVTFESAGMAAADFAKLLGGSFKVVLRGLAATQFAAKGAEADLQLTFTFAAFE